jgi:hypothetical protein
VRAKSSAQASKTPRRGVPARGSSWPWTASSSAPSRAKRQSGKANAAAAARALCASAKRQTSMLHTCATSPCMRV